MIIRGFRSMFAVLSLYQKMRTDLMRNKNIIDYYLKICIFS